MAVSYSFNGEELTSKPKHVGHSGERELLLALFETTGGKASKDSNWATELKKLKCVYFQIYYNLFYFIFFQSNQIKMKSKSATYTN